MKFATREEAGMLLAEKLVKYKDENTLVLVVPRGGMPVAVPCIKALNCGYDFLIPRKIGSPLHEEFAIGAVAMDGTYMLSEEAVHMLGVSPQYIQRTVGEKIEEIKERMKKYRGHDEPLAVKDKTVIIIDDGIATGYTLMAGVKSIQKQQPKKVIIAVPVAPRDTIERLEKEIEEVVALHVPGDEFGAVGAYYEDFHQVSDEEMFEMMEVLK